MAHWTAFFKLLMLQLFPAKEVLLYDTQFCKTCTEFVQDMIGGRFPKERWRSSREASQFFILQRITSHHSNVESLRRSGASGCRLCHILTQTIPTKKTGWMGKMEESPHNFEIVVAPEYHHSTFVVKPSDSASSLTFYSGYSAQEVIDTTPFRGNYLGQALFSSGFANRPRPFTIAREIFQSPVDARCIALLSTWLQACLTKHPKCTRSIPSPLPKRVIDVGKGGSDPYLYISANESGTYLALSYCWGGGISCKLTKANLESYTRGITLDTLPQTLQDAIVLTRALKFRYLWIDALCIIQDDMQDCQHQTAEMSHIYSNACLSISAIESVDCHEGFLGNRQVSQTELGMFKVTAGADKKLFGIRPERYVDWDRGPLSRRAWAFQERFLSPALVHYSYSRGLVWECKSTCIAESGEVHETNPILKAISFSPLTMPRMDSQTADLGMLWAEAISYYTALHLTFPSDKLPAISGVARFFQSQHGWEYCAGLWKHDIVRGLLWSGPDSGLTRAFPYRAPTWSWAAYTGKIKWDSDLLKPIQLPCPQLALEIHKIHVVESLPGSCGAVLRGQIELQGLLYDAKFTKGDDSQSYGPFYGDLTTDFGNSVQCVIDTDFSTRACWVLPLGMFKNRIIHRTLWALVLERLDPRGQQTGSENCYVRAGVAGFMMKVEPTFNQANIQRITLI